ncbi:MAG TPA: helix-turn-helix domain-containing protein [Syntrophobacteraceae bacterium]|nr:helix-turn-helix domain-containing protein [Syntrophobacteraceae bacterium]
MEEYLTIKELCERIKYERQTIYNLIHRGIFKLGEHFLKPSPKKILFRWSAIQAWLGEISHTEDSPPGPYKPDPVVSKAQKASLIRI